MGPPGSRLKTMGPLNPAEVVRALDGEGSRRVLIVCVAFARSAHDVSVATAIPLTTVYRLIHRLEQLRVLVVERSAMTPEGRKYDLYRSRVRGVHLHIDEAGDHVSWEPNIMIEARAVQPRTLLAVDDTIG